MTHYRRVVREQKSVIFVGVEFGKSGFRPGNYRRWRDNLDTKHVSELIIEKPRVDATRRRVGAFVLRPWLGIFREESSPSNVPGNDEYLGNIARPLGDISLNKKK